MCGKLSCIGIMLSNGCKWFENGVVSGVCGGVSLMLEQSRLHDRFLSSHSKPDLLRVFTFFLDLADRLDGLSSIWLGLFFLAIFFS